MAYFSNGSEWENYQNHYCERCVNWKNDGYGEGCTIDDIHKHFGAETANSKGIDRQILDWLIPEEITAKGKTFKQCMMFNEKKDG